MNHNFPFPTSGDDETPSLEELLAALSAMGSGRPGRSNGRGSIEDLMEMLGGDPSVKVSQRELDELKSNPEQAQRCARCHSYPDCATWTAFTSWKQEQDALHEAAKTSPLAAMQLMLPEQQKAIQEAVAAAIGDKLFDRRFAGIIDHGVTTALADEHKLLEKAVTSGVNNADIEKMVALGVAMGINAFFKKVARDTWRIVTWPFRAAWWIVTLPVKIGLIWPAEFVFSAFFWRRIYRRLATIESQIRRKLYQELDNEELPREVRALKHEILNTFDAEFNAAKMVLPFAVRGGMNFGHWFYDHVTQNVSYFFHYDLPEWWYEHVTFPWEENIAPRWQKFSARFRRQPTAGSEAGSQDNAAKAADEDPR